MNLLLPLLALYNSKFSVVLMCISPKLILSLIFFSPDPFFTLSVLFNSSIPGMIDALFQSTFLCSLLMFWLCIYHGLRQNERKFLTFYLPKLIVILPMWLCAIVLATWEKYNELRDPTYNHFVDTGNYQVNKNTFQKISCNFGFLLILMLYHCK